ncbi:hypothetical protein A6770_25400 [Nostoc minutum NIES-26]|uniref:SH3b domain-containing protein n=1 Tax=Nostoc minutum NIES-26 TaxID=1844469 RepID=A0A367QVD3_9NOSO|nr:hypothetical protein A6770_25400 [Nostoc minutum NIES-26]
MLKLFNKRFLTLAVLMASSVTGYISCDLPALAESEACEYWEVTATSINVRDNNSTRAKIIATLPKGAVIQLHGWSQDGKWADISTQQYQGWVFADYLKCYGN